MDKRKIWAIVALVAGGLIVVTTILAGVLPGLYRAGLVYPGFGWYKAAILVVGLAIAAFGDYYLFHKNHKKKTLHGKPKDVKRKP